MPNLLSALTTPALIGLLLTASLLVVGNDWRLGFATISVQYVLAAVLVAEIAVWQVAATVVLMGVVVVAMLVVTGLQVNFGLRPEADAQDLSAASLFEFSTGLPFRLTAVMMIAAGAWYLAGQGGLTLSGVPVAVNVAGFLLMGLGLLNVGLTEEPMNAGLGLLTLLTGFQVVYTAVEPSLAVLALLASVQLAVTLAVSYLAFVRYAEEVKDAG